LGIPHDMESSIESRPQIAKDGILETVSHQGHIIGGFLKYGTPKWMVYGMDGLWKNPTKIDDLGVALFSETSN